MLTVRLSRRHRWDMMSLCLIAGVLLWGCAQEQAVQPSQPPVDVSKRLAPLEECVARSQRAVATAAEAGVSAGTLAPANSSIADAQDALDETRKLAQQNKPQEATERATRGLEACAKIDTMVVKARQDTAERKARAQLASEAEARIAQTAACVDGARQVVRRISAVRAKKAEAMAAKGALDRAALGLKQARELLAQNDPKGALGLLDAAQADCQTAQAAGAQGAAPGKPASATAKPRRNR
jgi:hypothetical protein